MPELINYYENKEERGIIYNWGKIFKEYRRILKGAHVHEPIFDPTTAPVNEAKYFIYMSERTSGKTTNWILIGMIMHMMYGTQIQYVRQTVDMIKPSVAGEIFNVIKTYNDGYYIRAITGGRYSGIYVHWKKAYFCNFDETNKATDISPEPFLQFLSIDNAEDYKSTYNAPKGDLILFDEFIGKYYRPNEFCDFMDLCATIIRKRKSPIVVLAANTININSTYFKEFEISKEVKKLNVGKHDLITTEKGTRVYVEIIGLKQSNLKQELNRLFFGFDNPKLAAITGGEITWAFDPVPHIVNSPEDEYLDRTTRIDTGDVLLQLDIVMTPDRGVVVNVHECTKIYEDSLILKLGDITKPNELWGLGQGNFCKYIWGLYGTNKFYYDTNETGSIVANYVKQYRLLRK